MPRVGIENIGDGAWYADAVDEREDVLVTLTENGSARLANFADATGARFEGGEV